MAPDLNSTPPSTRPHSDQTHPTNGTTTAAAMSPRTSTSRRTSTSSRRASQIFPMSPPPLPLASPGGGVGGAASGATTVSPGSGHSHQSGFPPLSPHAGGTAGGGSGSGRQQEGEPGVPMRHPRPLTAAELHLELEQEQEAVVNRLTRELSALRAHSASVASNATTASMSSTSTGAPGIQQQQQPYQPHPFLFEATDPTQAHAGALTGPTHPTAARQRSESSVSRGSVSGGTAERAAERGDGGRGSVTLPHRYSVSGQQGPYQQHQQQQHTPSGQHLGDSSWLSNSSARSPGTRFEEAAQHKVELEEAKRENEGLRRRIRELEAELRGRRRSSAADTSGLQT
ncbi:hypothetical protein K490DRAFT_68155 [Saccharata proteae CBS 121410]|uniref:BZIP domain-containing protein n=1 Tax=Saccharata proteae CBS 121410 TaxID=1314787 RepID=A0A9P4HS57_9PEZI|nr:hypothetical protein K490DRAFT_68155 [Saccharata proteae CBS 121410]